MFYFQVAPGPFHGFSTVELEEAMAEARLQQKEAESEMKKTWEEYQFMVRFSKGIIIN